MNSIIQCTTLTTCISVAVNNTEEFITVLVQVIRLHNKTRSSSSSQFAV